MVLKRMIRFRPLTVKAATLKNRPQFPVRRLNLRRLKFPHRKIKNRQGTATAAAAQAQRAVLPLYYMNNHF